MDKHKVDINLKVDKLTKSLELMSTLCLSITEATINKNKYQLCCLETIISEQSNLYIGIGKLSAIILGNIYIL